MKVNMEVGKTYLLRNDKTVILVYKSASREDPYLGVVQTDGYDEDTAIWFDEDGYALNENYNIKAQLRVFPWR